jgi:hypothetical protein
LNSIFVRFFILFALKETVCFNNSALKTYRFQAVLIGSWINFWVSIESFFDGMYTVIQFGGAAGPDITAHS